LRTYRGENGLREASDGEVARLVFNGGADGIRRCSVSKDSFGGDGVGRGSGPSDESARESSLRRLDDSVVARQWWLGFSQIRTGYDTIYRGFCTES
jgi:hypothetical protein